MARTHARILVSIWSDPHFVQLSASEQRLYLLLLSQPDLSLCGVLALRPKRWARLCPADSTESVTSDLKRLEAEGYVMVDRDVDEVWIRSFIKYDGILRVPNMRKGMWNAFEQVVSEDVRNAFRNAVTEADSNGDSTGSGVGVGVGVGAGARKIVERCARCNLISFDCQCPPLALVGGG